MVIGRRSDRAGFGSCGSAVILYRVVLVVVVFGLCGRGSEKGAS